MHLEVNLSHRSFWTAVKASIEDTAYQGRDINTTREEAIEGGPGEAHYRNPL